MKKKEKELDLQKLQIIKEKSSYNHYIKNEMDFKKELERLIHYIPNDYPYFREKLKIIERKKKIDYYFDYTKKLNDMVLIKKAIEKAMDQLYDIRFNGLSCHSQGHSVAFLIKKLIKMLLSTLMNDNLNNVFLEYFENKVRSHCEEIQNKFNDIFELFVNSNFSKREKQLLLRSFYKPLLLVFDKFIDFDIEYEYFGLYDWGLDRMLYLIRDLPENVKEVEN